MSEGTLRVGREHTFSSTKARATALTYGTLWMLTDPDAPRFDVWVMVDELPTCEGEAEKPTWRAWAAEEASWRHRRLQAWGVEDWRDWTAKGRRQVAS